MRARYVMAGESPHEAVTWLAPVIAVVSAALGAFGLWLANRMLGKAAFQTAINSGFKDLTDQLQEERGYWRTELDKERVSAIAERAQLRGDIINLTQTIESLKALLRRNGIAIPEVYQAPVEMVFLEGRSTDD